MQTATIYNFADYKAKQRPSEAIGFCDGLTLEQSINKITDRIIGQYNKSITVNQQIDEDQAEITEHIIGTIRDVHRIPTHEIEALIEETFETRLIQRSVLTG